MRNLSFPILIAASALALCVACGSRYDEPEASSEAICCGGGCCLIDAVCYRDGEANPNDADEICDVSCSQFEFTPMSGCGGDPDMGPMTDPDNGPVAGDPDNGPVASDPDMGMDSTGSGGCSVSAAGQGGSLAGLFAVLGLALFGLRRRHR